ncbi:uncharacterized protein LOC111709445 isoform X2 [Eurytemora carolleeae]|uniref:uncharacterized protein LOC111709445 isoform X2 n=1 Tax=Eurytemora carolleeae TaxID=1294199 RepID=UPI000C77DB9C|nr:uncharacterized protein LOC111709445 isoform X2 [Eurytemora carolleeae]|eukprot:XP_023338871.1 uncharacterized protein LOC111709445 isoform X2 [Eurytemora affinis]
MYDLEKREKLNEIVELMKKNDWQAVLDIFQEDEDYREPLLVWIRPSISLVNFLEQELSRLGLKKISSIGCGCGALEWIIQEASDLEVYGFEVNKGWWEGPHSTPHYIPLEYVTEKGQLTRISDDSAIMFCYFNNMEYFHQYLDNYTGPIDGLRHCEPEPGYLEQFKTEWILQGTYILQPRGLISCSLGDLYPAAQGTFIMQPRGPISCSPKDLYPAAQGTYILQPRGPISCSPGDLYPAAQATYILQPR